MMTMFKSSINYLDREFVRGRWYVWLGTLVLACGLLMFSLNRARSLEAREAMSAGSITGSVELKISAPPLPARGSRGRYQTRGSGGTASKAAADDLSDPRNVVVYLEGRGLSQYNRPPARRPVLDQQELNFLPHVLPVIQGTTINIVNRDDIYHNVFSLSAPKRFNIGRRPAGEVVPLTLDKSGVVQVFCDIHAHMTAFIVVLENSFFTKPDAEGKYVLDAVPPGRYLLLVWHERLSAEPREVTVESGAAMRVDFVLE